MKRLLSTALIAAALLPLSAFAATYSFSVTNTGFVSGPSTGGGLTHGEAGTWGISGTTGASNYSTGLWADINTGNKIVTSAKVTITGIYDWTGETVVSGVGDPNDALFINILGGVGTGVSSQYLFDPTAVGRNADTSWPTQGSPFVNNPATTDWNDALKAAGLSFTDVTMATSANSLLTTTTAGSSSTDASGLTKAGTPGNVTWSDPSGGVASTLVLNFSASNLAFLTTMIDNDMAGGTAPTVGLGFAAECHYYMTSVTLDITTSPRVPDSGSTFALMGLGLAALVGFRRAKK